MCAYFTVVALRFPRIMQGSYVDIAAIYRKRGVRRGCHVDRGYELRVFLRLTPALYRVCQPSIAIEGTNILLSSDHTKINPRSMTFGLRRPGKPVPIMSVMETGI